jgi:hypothetical protein
METADQCIAQFLGVTVADWVRNTVMLTALAIWTVYVVVTLVRGEDIQAIVWGFPGAVYFAMNPTLKRGGKDGPQ